MYRGVSVEFISKFPQLGAKKFMLIILVNFSLDKYPPISRFGVFYQ